MWHFFEKSSALALLLVLITVGCSVQPPPPPVEVAEIEADLDPDFANELQSVQTVLVKFGATWCGPCVRLDKELEGLQSSLGDNAKIISIDIDKNRKLAKTFDVGAIPHMILFRDGKSIDQKVGYRSADEVAKWMRLSPNGAASTANTSSPGAIQSNPFASAQ